MVYLANAFSLQMVPGYCTICVEDLTTEEVVKILKANDYRSIVGHADTARLLSAMLEADVETNRVSLTLRMGDTLIVAQVLGGRLPEGCTTLPEGITIGFRRVRLV